MQLILHTGAHYTEQDRLIKSLMRNAPQLRERGVMIPPPGNYRKLVRDTLNAMHRTPAGPEARDVLLDVILEDEDADRVILSDPNFFRTAGTAVRQGMLYPDAAARMRNMADLFPDDDLEIFLAIRNPAALLPVLHSVALEKSDTAFWGGKGPMDVKWSDTLSAIRQAAPRLPITVWCNEDMPLIWSQIIREMAGLEHHEKIAGGFDLLAAIMSKEGMQRFRAYLDNHPGMSEMQKRRVIGAFLDKFALEDEIEEELDMPGWTDELVEQMTELYDEDVLTIQRIPGVTMVTP
ncbi:hypothetical protein BOO69_10950 [Sulfitobacter alexandrii]|uniref:Sulfotransferase domain-containing protein n=1 Tax=Sulfitobacter alexandrii TaxID=1917485 RepID=A0A1J0WHR7_9RHOB|nr:hypothetical protein [Sulfitobacter alexandrii]APE43871.1 hypothetical protein BOO69_10950 [Sulfitobacter alexandrii]